MMTEVSVIIIASAFVVLVGFLIATLLQARRTLKSARRDLHHVSTEAVRLMHKIEALTTDIQSKSDSLNFVFRPLRSLNKSHKDPADTVSEVANWVTIGLVLFEKLRDAVRHHAK